ncbi:tail fiber assembly protein [Parvibaculum sp.]|uniref:tail fiber assembly protein n=1 Tax=Parvibaculum sp. TaxID=2024848 RepID=UPI0027301233|nr:tail fiber assembly protein [Parvibaculum sp.]MDP1628869.1 tail fiber assembly protein [Parvibaculum sp.]MDP2148264.1 tail fiber assembly protein [Parvibaculum sp.]MDP3327739.1 tail fiber assembly protein [Parvibaculum sp.]
MTKFFSATTGGFHDSETHGQRRISIPDPAWTRPHLEAVHPSIEIDNPDCLLPPDAVEISDETHAALLAALAEGKWIAADANGLPVAIDPPPPSPEEQAGEARRQRDRLLAASDWTQLPDAPLDEAARAAWQGYRTLLRAVPEQEGFPASIDWPAAPGA